MPRAEAVRFSRPGPVSTAEPPEPRWRMRPTNGQVTVCNPMCGCGSMSGGAPVVVTVGEPKWSRKHHAPTVGRSRCGSTRSTYTPRTPPRGTSRAGNSRVTGPGPGAGAHNASSGYGSRSLIGPPCHRAGSAVRPGQMPGVLGMPVDVARDEPAGRHDGAAAGDGVVQRALRQGAAQSLAAEGVVDLGVHEIDAVAALLVLDEARQLIAEEDLVAALVRVPGDPLLLAGVL